MAPAAETMADKIAMAALKNQTVQKAVKKSLFESVMGKEPEDTEEDKRTSDASVIEGKLNWKVFYFVLLVSKFQKDLFLLFILK
jgi:hypothetical protein